MVKYQMGKTGTKEWAKKNINISTGCSNRCLYCYAREMKSRLKQVKAENWGTEVIDEAKIAKSYRKVRNDDPSIYDVMTPTVHDLTPATIEGMVTVLKKTLDSDNSVVIVSKPRLDCIKRLVEELNPWMAQIVFRFTITSKDDTLLKYWEPGAPGFDERLKSLEYAFNHGFTTSVSVEPCLNLPDVANLVGIIDDFVSETIWIGKMNKVKLRVAVNNEEDRRMVAALEAGQTDAVVLEVYNSLKNHPKIRWKDSFKETLKKKYSIIV